MKKILMTGLLLIVTALMLTTVIFSETVGSNSVDVGLGVFYRNNVYKEKDNDSVLPVPFIGMRIKAFYFEAPLELGYHFFSSENLILTAYGRYNLYTGYKPEDMEDEFKDMDKRNDDLHLGLRGKYNFGPWGTELISHISGDISGKSNGGTARAELSQPLFFGRRVVVQPYIAAEYMNKSYSDYYFGIKDSEAARGINNGKSYKAEDTYNMEGGIRSIVTINNNFKGLISAGYVRYGNEVADSPLVKDRDIYTLGLGIVYSFEF